MKILVVPKVLYMYIKLYVISSLSLSLSFFLSLSLSLFIPALPSPLSFIQCQHLHIPTMENGPQLTTQILNKLTDIQVRNFIFFNQIK